jgi:hypothetical protein
MEGTTVPTFSNTTPDPALVRTSATEQLAAFRSSPPPVSGRLLSDNEMEGQMRGLPEICFQLAHTRAETSAVDTCAAVGYISKDGHAMRIYRKTAGGWSQHTFTLNVEMPPKTKQPKGRQGRTAPDTRPPVYSWQIVAPKATHAARTSRRQQLRHH